MLHTLDSNFILGNAAAPPDYPIVYCSDGFCALTGEQLGPICQYSRWPLNGRYIAILLPLGILLNWTPTLFYYILSIVLSGMHRAEIMQQPSLAPWLWSQSPDSSDTILK